MGFRFRKSINLGHGVRVNISKSGVGYSVGTKGARITKTARGTTRKTMSVPGTGISYVSETGRKRKNTSRAKSSSVTTSKFSKYDNIPNGIHQNVKGAPNPMKAGFSIVKKILVWGLSIVFLSGGFVFWPSVSGILAFVLVALILPIQKWQDLVSKVMKGKVKVIVAIILAIAMFSTMPATPETGENGSETANTPTVATTDIPKTTSEPTAAPTSEPTPTVTPTQTPTAPPTFTPASTPVPILKTGSKGQSVVELQERLIELDYLEGTADGDFGNGTKKAVIAFQKNNDLSADGVAGEQTLTILFSDQAVRQHWVWIPMNGGEKYHSKSSCSGMENPKRVTYREAIEQGYDACGKCY